MNNQDGAPWYRVPGSNGDRLKITPEIKGKSDSLGKELKALRRKARHLEMDESSSVIDLKRTQRDAATLRESALDFFNYITSI